MQPQLGHVGEAHSPVVTIDGFGGDVDAIVGIAAALAPFPAQTSNYYPGLRRVLSPADKEAWAYVEAMLADAAPFLGGAFDFDRFDLLEASFSMVTAAPEALSLAQRAPHFDSTDPGYVALLHYLGETEGTAFYRQRSTGIERIDEANMDAFVAAAKRENGTLSGYTAGSNALFDEIGRIDGRAGRLAIYQGCLLHSGIIPPDADLSADPRRGRLTANIFIKGYRDA